MNTKRKHLAVVSSQFTERHLSRAEPRSGLRVFHVVIPSSSGNVEAEVLDYHFRGASLQLSVPAFERFLEFSEQGQLHFYLGSKCLKFGIGYRLCWKDSESCQVGIEFKTDIKEWVQRDLRIPTHAKIKPSISGTDPADPNRKVFFSVENVSSDGMMLSTSLSNKHIFPGMELRGVILVVPGREPVELDLSVQNVHLSDDKTLLCVGTLVRTQKKQIYNAAFQDYLAALGDIAGIDQVQYKSSDFFTKKLKSSLTFKTISTQSEYLKVLELRFMGYGHKGKVRQGQRLEDMGEGLQNEGMILGAYLGKLLVASVELRFGSDLEKGFRFCTADQLKKVGIQDIAKYAEVNKLVVHPSYQGSDILLGIFHRMHAIGVSGGGLGAIIAATDQLKGLYLKIGARDTGLRIKHPHLENTSLNLLVVEAAVYMGESEFNPFLWKAVYGTLNEYLASHKLASRPRHSKLTYYAGFAKFFIETVKKKLNKSKKPPAGKVALTVVPTQKVANNGKNSRYTEQHIHVSQIKPYLMFASEKIGVQQVESILADIGFDAAYFNAKSNWVSIEFLDDFLDQYSKFGDLAEISIEAGRISTSKDVLGVNYHVLKNFGSHATMVNVLAQFSPRFNKTRTIRVIDLQRSKALVELGVVQGSRLPRHKESCLNWQSNLKHFGLIAGGEVKVKKLSCAYEGDPTTIYEISWTAPAKNAIAFLKYGLLGITSFGLVRSAILSRDAGHFDQLFAFAALVCLGYMLFLENQKRRDKIERDDQTQKLQEESEMKYADLQEAKTLIEHRYQEALLLDRISVMIQGSGDLGGILKVGLKQACELLDYKRAFVMILNTDSKKLETAAVYGTVNVEVGLSKFSVDVSARRENPVLLSSVYHSGQSVMINDVSEHLFQLNESSKALIQRLQVERFVMIAVPSEHRNWGVIVAEKNSDKGNLSKKDVVLLERVGQMMGVALDKHAAFESEARLRKSFQRYVPASVIEELTASNATHLGGIEKKICCLFLDIRSFTNLSSTIGPQMSVDLLNRFFGFVQPVFAKYGGSIDKYLGDGVLVTWGAIDHSANMETKAVRAALEVLSLLSTFNAQNIEAGLPNIEVGMGVHAGPAIVGNVGCADRMEFTAIGHTVNFASRLEALNKIYKTKLCVSEQVLAALESTLESRFSRVSGVAVRGVSGQTNIALLDLPSDLESEKVVLNGNRPK